MPLVFVFMRPPPLFSRADESGVSFRYIADCSTIRETVARASDPALAIVLILRKSTSWAWSSSPT